MAAHKWIYCITSTYLIEVMTDMDWCVSTVTQKTYKYDPLKKINLLTVVFKNGFGVDKRLNRQKVTVELDIFPG